MVDETRLYSWQERIETDQHEMRKQVADLTTAVSGIQVSQGQIMAHLDSIGKDFKTYRDRVDDRSRPDVRAWIATAISSVALLAWFGTLGNTPLEVKIEEQRMALKRDIAYAQDISALRDEHSTEQDKLLDNALQQEMRALIQASSAEHRARINSVEKQITRHQDRNHHDE